MPLVNGLVNNESQKKYWKFKKVGSRVAVGAAVAAASVVVSLAIVGPSLSLEPVILAAIGISGFALGRNIIANKQKKDLGMKRHKIFGRTKGENVELALQVASVAIPMAAFKLAAPGILIGTGLGIGMKLAINKFKKIKNKKKSNPIPAPAPIPTSGDNPDTSVDDLDDVDNMDDVADMDGADLDNADNNLNNGGRTR